ncbi:efflux RND transporter periplasmic adaptor subunit [Mesorhizobium sp. BAC0120]|uniref:efflux RND transporter periplasmic adaptor subunit n=1 Tax=Mesorhizobium sp. BAC0120 TaxID=3090670 RepID=UPI00298C6E3D|nr:efflux RND transporter periplasmic adaptor subunit [Mesorhizobium sp. BAC0120]MDW6024385.1 efflux RND transporter periplasmic adaptor subunit [Mesorhizobium sp. BAC0120]
MFSPSSITKGTSAVGLAAVAALSMLASGCTDASSTGTVQVVRPVKVVEIVKADDTRKLDFSGSVKARKEMNLGFRIAGKITQRVVDIGDRVKPGDLLASIDPTDYELAVKTAEANLAAAERQVDTAGSTRKRTEQLFAKNFASQAQVDDAVMGYQQAVSTRDAAVSALQQAKNQVTYSGLKSDQTGIVTAINADIGQVVSAGTPVVTVAIDGEKEVQIAVPETDISQFQPGKTVEARFWADSQLVLQAKVREVSGSADQQSRTFSVRVSLPRDTRVLLGMTATVTAAVTDGKPSQISLPLSALAEKDGREIVWVVDRSTSTVHARDVKVTDFAADGVHVADGLQPGDVVVAAGTQFMTENLQVKLPAGDQSASAETSQVIR